MERSTRSKIGHSVINATNGDVLIEDPVSMELLSAAKLEGRVMCGKKLTIITSRFDRKTSFLNSFISKRYKSSKSYKRAMN